MGLSRARSTPTRARIGERINLPALTAVIIWSGVAPFAKYALAQFPWLAFTALRPLVAAVLLFGLLWLRRMPVGIPAGNRGRLALAGLGLGVSQLCFIGGLARTDVAPDQLRLAGSHRSSAAINHPFTAPKERPRAK